MSTKFDFRKDKVPFTQVANDVLAHPEMSLKAKGLYSYMYSKPDGWDFSYVRIADEVKETKNTVLKIIHELEKFGYLQRFKQSTGRVDYVLQIKPMPNNWSQGQRPKVGHISNKDIITKEKNEKKDIELPFWVNEKVWQEWVAFRKEKKKTLTPITIKKQLKMLSEYKKDHVAMLEQSMTNGWVGIFPIKTSSVTSKNGSYSDKARAFDKRLQAEEEDRLNRENEQNNDALRKLNAQRKQLSNNLSV